MTAPEEQVKEHEILPCTHRMHEPPGHMVIRHRYEHVCPSCGRRVVINPTRNTMRGAVKEDLPEGKVHPRRNFK